MTVPRLPTMSVPAPRPTLQKIALEEAYATGAGVKLDDDGIPDWAWFMEENALNRQYMDAVAPRLLDFDRTRLQAMDESGIEYIVNPSELALRRPPRDDLGTKSPAHLVHESLARSLACPPQLRVGDLMDLLPAAFAGLGPTGGQTTIEHLEDLRPQPR